MVPDALPEETKSHPYTDTQQIAIMKTSERTEFIHIFQPFLFKKHLRCPKKNDYSAFHIFTYFSHVSLLPPHALHPATVQVCWMSNPEHCNAFKCYDIIVDVHTSAHCLCVLCQGLGYRRAIFLASILTFLTTATSFPLCQLCTIARFFLPPLVQAV